jgi:uracil-DNA glycosylase family 4
VVADIEWEPEDSDVDRWRLIRELRQRLESLQRAGLSSIPAAPPNEGVRLPAHAKSPVPRLETTARVEAELGPPAVRPESSPAPAPAPRAAAPAAPPAPRSASTGLSLSTASLFQEPALEAAPVAAAERPALLKVLAAEVSVCTKCTELAATRTQTVFADGSPTARLMFIGEAPGAHEDRQGVPFVGPAGQLLTDMITKGMGLKRQDVYIANILKCRPPENRDPTLEESSNCIGYLERQIEIVRPEFLCLLGRIATSTLLETTLSMSRLRGKWHRYRGIPTVVTYHPAYLLRYPAFKKESWEDLQMLMNALGLPVRARGKGPS